MKGVNKFVEIVSDVLKCDVEILMGGDGFVRIARAETYLLIDLNADGSCEVEHAHPELEDELVRYKCELDDLHAMLSSSLFVGLV